MRAYRLFSVSILLLLVAAFGLPVQAKVPLPICTQSDQECASCGGGCEMLCTYYDCDDGTTRVNCGSCDCIRQCIVP